MRAAFAAPWGPGTLVGARFWIGSLGRRDGGCLVFDAVDEHDGRPALLRRCPAESPGGAAAAARFRALLAAGEAMAPETALLPFAAGTDESGSWIATRPPAGRPLTSLASAGIRPDAAVRIVLQAARTTAAVRRLGVVHGDLRPARIFIAEDGAVQTEGFGLAPTAAGRILGLRHTEPVPEAALYRTAGRQEGDPPSAADDAHALAVILYEAIAGRRPFTGPTAEVLKAETLRGRPRRTGRASRALEALLRRAMNPGSAFADAESFAAALSGVAAPVGARISFWRRLSGGG